MLSFLVNFYILVFPMDYEANWHSMEFLHKDLKKKKAHQMVYMKASER
jgi:hypothetical protein